LHVHLTTTFVKEFPGLVGFVESTWIILVHEAEGALELKWVEVELLNAEGSGDASTFIKHVLVEHQFEGAVVKHVSGDRVDPVPLDVDRLTVQIVVNRLDHVMIVAKLDNQVSFVVAFNVTNDVDLVEVPLLGFGRVI